MSKLILGENHLNRKPIRICIVEGMRVRITFAVIFLSSVLKAKGRSSTLRP